LMVENISKANALWLKICTNLWKEMVTTEAFSQLKW
jgi:hypothetical protein